MKTPYTDAPLDALMIAQSCAGVVLSSVLWHKPVRSAPATMPIVAGIWLCVLAPIANTLVTSMTALPFPPAAYFKLLAVAAFLGTLTCALSMNFWLLVLGVVGQSLLYRLSHWVYGAEYELAVLHLAWLAVLVVVGQREPEPLRTEPDAAHAPEHVRDDLVLALLAFGLALIVCVVVLERGCDSDDEWAYTWQAAVFAHGHAYMPSPPCGDTLRNYWIFYNEGRAFSQYTPGWPGFMVPFALVHAPWLAGPVAHGLLAVAVARLSRRAVGAGEGGVVHASPRQVRAAGIIGALTATMGAAVILNGASRYSHIFVALLFAWCLELTASVIYDRLTKSLAIERAMLLGVCAAWLLATRPADGATLGTGIFFLFAYGIFRGRIGWRVVLAAGFGFASIGFLTLVILRVQLGKWFVTGYSLTLSYYPWAAPKFSLPESYQLRYGLPLVTTAYCFWPASVPLGVAGLFRARGAARPITLALGIGTLSLVTMYVLSELGRTDFDFGYGNRFQLPAIVLLGVGTALLLAPMFAPSSHDLGGMGRRPSPAFGPGALAAFAMFSGALRLAPLLWGPARSDIARYVRIEQAIARQGIHDAIVVANPRDTGAQALDVTRNWPEPPPDVIIAGETEASEVKCLREHFSERTFYRASGIGTEVYLQKM